MHAFHGRYTSTFTIVSFHDKSNVSMKTVTIKMRNRIQDERTKEQTNTNTLLLNKEKCRLTVSGHNSSLWAYQFCALVRKNVITLKIQFLPVCVKKHFFFFKYINKNFFPLSDYIQTRKHEMHSKGYSKFPQSNTSPLCIIPRTISSSLIYTDI
jgi:aminopeptidase C